MLINPTKTKTLGKRVAKKMEKRLEIIEGRREEAEK